MSNQFYGAFHWEFSPVEDRLELLDSLEVFCGIGGNLFIEVISPSIAQRFRLWRMRSAYRTQLHTDSLFPVPSVFHITLEKNNLEVLKEMVRRDGLSERSIAHIKGYVGEKGLFWFHGFCDEGDETLSCSRHVSEDTIDALEGVFGLSAKKKMGELISDRQRQEELKKMLDAIDRIAE